MRNFLLIIMAMILLAACKKDKTPVRQELIAQFRIQNNTPFKIESAHVILGTSEHTYPAIDAGNISDYKVFNDYNYPKVKFRVNNKDIEFQVQPFEGGKVEFTKDVKSTMVITYSANTATFDGHFVE